MADLTPADIDAARLPAAYVAARDALAACDRIDECRAWADRAHALASYARQARDDTLLNYARRIQARAVARVGALLRAVPNATGRRSDLHPNASPTRAQAARAAGLSRGQARDAIRIATIPRRVFEAAVESPRPPTITALAARGIRPSDRPPSVVRRAARVTLALQRFAELTADEDPAAAAHAIERDTLILRTRIARIQRWLTDLTDALDARHPPATRAADAMNR